MGKDFNRHKLSDYENECLRQAIQEIVTEHKPITVRGIYYQCVLDKRLPFVTKDSAGKLRNYRLVAKRVLDLRRIGLIPWDFVVDPSRNHYSKHRWSRPADFAEVAPYFYRKDYWSKAEWRPVVLVEKDGQVAVYEQFANSYGVDVWSCHGYGSATHLWSLAQYIKQTQQNIVILVCADWDPSGCDWPRAAEHDLSVHLSSHRKEVVFQRVLITKDHVAALGELVALRAPNERDPRVSNWLWENDYSPNDEVVVEMDAIPPKQARLEVGLVIEEIMSEEDIDLSENSELERQERCKIETALSLIER